MNVTEWLLKNPGVLTIYQRSGRFDMDYAPDTQPSLTITSGLNLTLTDCFAKIDSQLLMRKQCDTDR